ncbi:MAG TPA: TrkA C-terminal domain-containing protein [Ktedonobacterales bacterium]|nr:TrkA C-terminal domain-containing protein [Ktedonobacterales bacterium]
MIALVSFLVVVTLSLVIERVATVALGLTGLSRDSARFQARSALTGTGFTTAEAEQVATHPARRRIIMLLMGIRNLEIISGVSTLVLVFVNAGSSRTEMVRVIALALGLTGLMLLAWSPWVDRHLTRWIAYLLRRWTTLDVLDYTTLLGLTDGYAVLDVPVAPNGWTAYRRLSDLDLPNEGVTVLAIRRANGEFVGAPPEHTEIGPQDRLILYGFSERLGELSGRLAGAIGDQAHLDAVAAQRIALDQQADGASAQPPRVLEPQY